MHNESSTVLVAGTVIDAYRVRHQPGAFLTLLDSARRVHGHALCLCQRPPLKLQLRERSGRIHLAAWPDQGNLHSVSCPFYSEGEKYSSPRSGIAITDDGRTEIQYVRPLSYNGLAPTADRPKLSTPDNSTLRLWGLLHHLWESAGLNRWHPGWRRDWGFVRGALSRCAQNTWLNDRQLSSLLYIPRPFTAVAKQAIEAQWQSFATPLLENHRGSAEVRCGFMLGVVRALDTHAKGYLLRLAHHAQPVLLPSALAANLANNSRRGWASLTSGIDKPSNSSVVALLRVECSRNGLMVSADCVLMRTTRSLIPSNNQMEDQVANTLVDEDREFVRPLSYSQVQGDLPSFVLRTRSSNALDITEMFCIPDGKAMLQREAQLNRIKEHARASGCHLWVWALSETSAMPQLPSSAPRS